MKLNNKGMTIVEILVSFAIVIVIVASMYASISNLRNRQVIASYKEEATRYKDLLTRDVENDIITKGLVSATKISDTSVILKFKSGDEKTFSVNMNSSSVTNDLENATVCDVVDEDSYVDSITYDGVSYSLPNAGSDKLNINGKCSRIYSMRITDSIISVDSDMLSINVKIFHPDLGDKYSLEIITPIDYE